ncbi:hypothetical protein FF100_36815 [Methylobacterium terricola]|uniref:DUF6894 domain-containing protein n=1 Tax=Methylobacterium terricola TaxID=2583531 RepID=A0A5C4L733_9HYPH|nr:hypothetical protein [Methylobacterium terricola]TNC03822.1 hypothetical protein FF100_36815 [Methylobacterium terricola]
MAWYFFDIHDPHGSMHDRQGIECADADAARTQAVRTLCEFVHHAALQGFPSGASTTVRDETGCVVLSVKLAVTSE